MVQKILTRSQLTKDAPHGVTHKLIGIYIKEEDKKPKVELRENEFYQEDLTALRRKNTRKKTKPWPESAKLVHIDGTACSETCMTTSKYHQDLPEQIKNNVTTPTLTPLSDPRNTRPMGLLSSMDTDTETDVQQNSTDKPPETIKSGKLEVATNATPSGLLSDTPERNVNEHEVEVELHCATSTDKPSQTLNSGELEVATDAIPGELLPDTLEKNVNEHEVEAGLDCATPTNLQPESINNDYLNEDLNEQVEKDHHETSDSNLSQDIGTNITENKIQYNVSRTMIKHSDMVNMDLPDIDWNSHPPELELPSATPPVINDTQKPCQDQVTMLDNLPLLESHDDLEDFETLLNIADDYKNENLVPIDGPPQCDVMKEMDKNYGINTDLELAMENAKFIDQHLLVPKRVQKNKTQKRTEHPSTIMYHTETPGSPRG